MGVRREETRTLNEKSNLVLIGFMGTGKSSVGRSLARKLDMQLVDTDQEVESATGLTVPEIFRRYGEVRFRSEESLIVKKISRYENCVIATGGGVVLNEENLTELKRNGCLVCLRSRPEIIKSRVQRKPRPLLARDNSLENIQRMLQERERFYEKAELVVETSDDPLEKVVDEIADWFALRRSRQVRVDTDGGAYDIFIGQSLLSSLGTLMVERVKGKRCLLVSNPRVSELYAERVRSSLEKSGFKVTDGLVPDGEEYKSLKSAEQLYDAAVEAGLDRDSAVVALGGGVIGDLAGFIAATYLRGISLVQVPTTLLAQVDSSVGGKVAVNHPQGKNLIGAFHQPRLVVCDTDVLNTLDPREMRSGMAEVIKYGVIWDSGLFEHLERVLQAEPGMSPTDLIPIITRCCEIKADIVGRDEREHGVRTLLNLGHTLGHALEGETGYQVFRHGEAVAVGMAAAGRLAVSTGRWSEPEQDRLLKLLEAAGLPIRTEGIPSGGLMAWMERDKKAQGGRVRWVLPLSVGRAEVVPSLPDELVEPVIREFVR
ncbi:MAG: 3-dehydroquinate synthase [Firmicutes bacterium]|nr:3-dehydroquinate synthase [Bacillota bacterium]